MRHDQEKSKAVSDTDFTNEVLNLLTFEANPVNSIGHLKDTIFLSTIAVVTSQNGYSDRDINNLQQIYFFLQNLESKLTGKEDDNG